jgi:dihydroorotate dehydrogenase (NAD+) catalytic subunit
MSGPAIKPVAVRMIYQVRKACPLPIIGMGGVMTGQDAIELMMAGASMVSVGTANFHNPRASIEVLEGIKAFMADQKIEDVRDIIGCVE